MINIYRHGKYSREHRSYYSQGLSQEKFYFHASLRPDWLAYIMCCLYIVFLMKVLTHNLYVHCRNEPAYITMLAPFLQYLYCEPQRQPQYALLRNSLLRVLLPTQPVAELVHQKKEQKKSSAVSDSLLHCLCQLVPHMQVTQWMGVFRQ